MPYFISQARVIARALSRSRSYRYLHSATGKFTTINPKGTPTTREIELWVGDPGDSFVMFRPEIGRAFATGIMMQDGCSVAGDPDLYPLVFHHATRHFSHSMSAVTMGITELKYLFRSTPLPKARNTSGSSGTIKDEQQPGYSSYLRSDSHYYT